MRRFSIQIYYDTWEGSLMGWHVKDNLTGSLRGPYSRNRARYLASKWNKAEA